MRKTMAIVLAAGLSAAFVSSAGAAVLPSLGSASNFALLSVPGDSDWNLSNVTVTGNVGVGNVGASLGKVTNMAPSTITGNVYTTVSTGSTQYTGPGTLGGAVILDATLVNTAIADAQAADTAAQAMVATQTFGNISSATTVIGNGGVNVIQINGNITKTLSLTGTAADVFVVLVTGDLNLGGSDFIGASGSVLESNVLFDFTGANGSLNTHVGNDVKGTLMAFDYTGNLDGRFDAIYGGGSGTISLLSGAIVENDTPFVGETPEPASLGLLGLGAVGLLARRRRN